MSRKRIPIVPAPPDNPAAESLQQIWESLNRISDDELWALAIRAGIYTADGRLTKKYGGTADPDQAATA